MNTNDKNIISSNKNETDRQKNAFLEKLSEMARKNNKNSSGEKNKTQSQK